MISCHRYFRLSLLFVVVLAGVLFVRQDRLDAQNKRTWKPPPEAKQLKNPVAVSAAAVEKGAKLFRQYCVDCHGAKGDGKGHMADSLKRKPADLTSGPTKALADGEIFWRVSKGDDIMPSFEKTFPLPENERWELVHFVRSLGKKK
jgi:mono/diheme cytochrome c family protein